MNTLDRFAAEYQQGNVSRRRASEQRSALEALAAHAGCASPELATPPQFQTYLATLVARNLAPSYIVKIRRMILPFFTWARRAGLITHEQEHDLREIPNPVPAPVGLPRPYAPNELTAWWTAIDSNYPVKMAKTITLWRDGRAHYNRIWRHAFRLQLRAMTGLTLGCGLRRSELYAQTEITCHPDNAYVAVEKGKGGVWRDVPHSTLSRTLLQPWLDFRAELAPPHDSLWLGLNPVGAGAQDRLRPMNFRMFRGLPAGLGPFVWHRFRHTCGTEWLRAGMPLEKVQRLLGHADIKQTLAYARVVREDVRIAVGEGDDSFMNAVAPPEIRAAA